MEVPLLAGSSPESPGKCTSTPGPHLPQSREWCSVLAFEGVPHRSAAVVSALGSQEQSVLEALEGTQVPLCFCFSSACKQLCCLC